MFYHFLTPEGRHPSYEENSIENNYHNARSFLISHNSKLYQQKQLDVVLKKVQQRYIHLLNTKLLP